jgi:DNA-binding IclR family transcriptional regulator
MATSRIAAAVRRLTGMFVEQPERQLSLAEAARLTGLDGPSCQIVLETLRDARFLARADDGRFVRSDRPRQPASNPE